MKKISTINVVCLSCSYKCRFNDDDPNSAMNRCTLQKVSVWPENNNFLKKGVLSIISGKYESIFSKGGVYVDFSKANIWFFTNRNWIKYLGLANLNIIIICDREMEPLAQFWKKYEKNVHLIVISSRQSINDIQKNINYSYYGINREIKNKVRPLTMNEVRFLDHVVRGKSLMVTAEEMAMQTKKIYNIKQSISKKMGISLKKLLSNRTL